MVVIRGTPRDYDEWAESFGCRGWAYRDVLPYFIRSESNADFTDEFHGTCGPLGVARVVPHALTEAFVRAAEQAGIPHNADFNGPQLAGSGFYQSSSGVQIAEEGRLTTIRTEREVIVTAGAVGSPKLLLLSGIGPAAELHRLGIPCGLDLPGVGRNLQDHARIDLHYELNGPHSLDRYKSRSARALLGLEYLLFRRGIAASNNLDGGGFWWSDRSDPDPNIQFFFVPLSGGVPYPHGCSMNFYELRPRSRGTVCLRSADPLAQPLIDPNYFADPRDLDRTVAGIEVCRSIMRQPAMAALIRREYLPGPHLSRPEELARYAREIVGTGYHLVGSCRMGVDRDAVVTPELRVRGIAGLRICDSSVMPKLISGNTNAPSIMIAEKAADLIGGRRPPERASAGGAGQRQSSPGNAATDPVELT